MNDYQRYMAATQHLPKPFAYLDLDMFYANAAETLNRAGGKPVRIASKSIRCVTLLKKLLGYSPQIQGIMAYTVAEASWLCQQGFDNILVGYPSAEPRYIQEAAQLIRAGKTIVLMTDLREHLDIIEAVGKQEGVQIPVCVDVDLSMPMPGLYFGVYRSSIKGVADMERFLDHLQQKCPHIELRGLMGYEAQIAGVGDQVPGQFLKNAAVKWLKGRSIRQLSERRAAVVECIRKRGILLPLVNGGGTGSLESTAKEPWVTEVTAGSSFYNPHLFDNYQQFKHKPAAGFALEVTRIPAPNMVTCLGGGYVASGEAGPAKVPKPYLPEGLTLVAQEMTGEVQTPLKVKAGLNIHLGDPIFFRHAKAGELCEHFNELHLIQGGEVIGSAKTYRGEGMAFL